MRSREYPFDSLLTGLVDTLSAAREATRAQYHRQLQAFARGGQRTIGPAETGISVASLRAFQQMRIRELSIEFDCWLRPCRSTSTVQLVLRPPHRWQRRRVRRMLIELLDAPQPQARISIDGHLFKCVPITTTHSP